MSDQYVEPVSAADIRLVETVRLALRSCGLVVLPDGHGWAVVSVDDGATFPIVAGAYARRLTARELARWADGWLSCWRVWGGGKG